jgi:hypothetical protein
MSGSGKGQIYKMQNARKDLDRFNTPEVLRVVWETFATHARQPQAMDSSKHFNLEGEGSVFDVAFDKCSEADLIPNDVRKWTYPPFKHIVMKVYYSALNMGLLLPSRLDQALDWSAQSGPFHFTADGVRYFSEGFISIDDPGHLGEVLQELKRRIPAIEDGQIELLLEAQRCIKSGCNRAGMVVMGVASEDSCIALMDAIPLNCQAPASGSPLQGDWANCCNVTLNFTRRWKPATRILETIKRNIRSAGHGESWWPWWKMVPGSLHSVGEAVRIARNAAAHDTTRKFSKAEVALLLSAMPIQLEMIASLTSFLQKVPPNLTPLQV